MAELFPVNPLLVAGLYYVLGRAEITRWLWSRYPAWLDRLAMCPACSGFWLGCCAAIAGTIYDRGVHALPHASGVFHVVTSGLVSGLISLATMPILFAAMRAGLPPETEPAADRYRDHLE